MRKCDNCKKWVSLTSLPFPLTWCRRCIRSYAKSFMEPSAFERFFGVSQIIDVHTYEYEAEMVGLK